MLYRKSSFNISFWRCARKNVKNGSKTQRVAICRYSLNGCNFSYAILCPSNATRKRQWASCAYVLSILLHSFGWPNSGRERVRFEKRLVNHLWPNSNETGLFSSKYLRDFVCDFARWLIGGIEPGHFRVCEPVFYLICVRESRTTIHSWDHLFSAVEETRSTRGKKEK